MWAARESCSRDSADTLAPLRDDARRAHKADPDTTSSLAAVSCSGRGACTAVGSGASGVLVVREGAGGWSIQSAPNPDGATDPSVTAPGLTAVSCPTTKECVAVGSYTTPGGNTAAFAESWNGTSWSLQPTPRTDSDTSTSLSAITCPSAAKCIAAGTQTIGVDAPMSATTSTLTEQWTGSSWRDQSIQPPTPGDGSGRRMRSTLSSGSRARRAGSALPSGWRSKTAAASAAGRWPSALTETAGRCSGRPRPTVCRACRVRQRSCVLRSATQPPKSGTDGRGNWDGSRPRAAGG